MSAIPSTGVPAKTEMAWQPNKDRRLELVTKEMQKAIDTHEHTRLGSALFMASVLPLDTVKIAGDFPIFYAVKFGDLDSITAIANVFDPNVSSNLPEQEQRKALHLTVSGNKVRSLCALLAHKKTNVNALDARGCTALDYAKGNATFTRLIKAKEGKTGRELFQKVIEDLRQEKMERLEKDFAILDFKLPSDLKKVYIKPSDVKARIQNHFQFECSLAFAEKLLMSDGPGGQIGIHVDDSKEAKKEALSTLGLDISLSPFEEAACLPLIAFHSYIENLDDRGVRVFLNAYALTIGAFMSDQNYPITKEVHRQLSSIQYYGLVVKENEDVRRGALHYAVLSGEVSVVKTLLDSGNVNVNDGDRDEGLTALDYALKREGSEEIAYLLRARGGKTWEELDDAAKRRQMYFQVINAPGKTFLVPQDLMDFFKADAEKNPTSPFFQLEMSAIYHEIKSFLLEQNRLDVEKIAIDIPFLRIVRELVKASPDHRVSVEEVLVILGVRTPTLKQRIETYLTEKGWIKEGEDELGV